MNYALLFSNLLNRTVVVRCGTKLPLPQDGLLVNSLRYPAVLGMTAKGHFHPFEENAQTGVFGTSLPRNVPFNNVLNQIPTGQP